MSEDRFDFNEWLSDRASMPNRELVSYDFGYQYLIFTRKRKVKRGNGYKLECGIPGHSGLDSFAMLRDVVMVIEINEALDE